MSKWPFTKSVPRGKQKRWGSRIPTRGKLDWLTAWPPSDGCVEVVNSMLSTACPLGLQIPLVPNTLLRSTYEGNATMLRVVCKLLFWLPPASCCVNQVLYFKPWAVQMRAGVKKYTEDQLVAPGGPYVDGLFDPFYIAEARWHRIHQRSMVPEQTTLNAAWCLNEPAAPLQSGTLGSGGRYTWELDFDDKVAMKLTGQDGAYLDLQFVCLNFGAGGLFDLSASCPTTPPLMKTMGFVKVLVRV